MTSWRILELTHRRAAPRRRRLLQRLEFLDASDNAIEFLPSKFGELKWLGVARLARNHVVDMRPLVGLSACRELDVSRNDITRVPDSIAAMTSLVTLDLSHNSLDAITPAICFVSSFSFRRHDTIRDAILTCARKPT